MSLGYSEPDSGSDVASIKTRAIRDGDEWVINGQKMFTTLAHEANYVFLLARTNPDVPKHKGLTMFLVPLDSPGIEIQPVHTVGGERTNATFYNDVRVSDHFRIGEVDGGWDVMTVALTFERGGFGLSEADRVWEQAVAWAKDDPACATEAGSSTTRSCANGSPSCASTTRSPSSWPTARPSWPPPAGFPASRDRCTSCSMPSR